MSMLLLAQVVAGCGEQEPATAPTDRQAGPSHSFVNGPSSPGPVVIRVSGVPVFLAVNDPDRNLMSIHLNVADNPICGTAGFDDVDVQRVSAPSVIGTFIAHRMGDDTHVAVYATADFAEAGFLSTGFDPSVFCSFIAGPKRLGEGSARYERLAALPYQITDRWVGLLTADDGATIGYTDLQHGILDPSTGDFARFTDHIVLRTEPAR